jgi:hypothetical protein
MGENTEDKERGGYGSCWRVSFGEEGQEESMEIG